MALVQTSRPAEGVLLVEMDDPQRYNALSSRMITELKDAFGALKDDRETRVVVLRGLGRGFCAGANMGGDDDTPERAKGRGPVGFIHEYQEHIAELMLAVHEARRERLVRGLRHAQILERMAGRGAVDDHQIPTTAVDLVPDLADRHQLLQPGRRGDEVLVDLAVEDGIQHSPNRDDQAEVLLERRLAFDVQAKEAGQRLHRIRAFRLAEARDRARAIIEIEPDEQHALLPAHGGERKPGGDRGLADAALADDEEEPAVEEGGHGYRLPAKPSRSLLR
jgi:hypothetical protein